MDDDIGRLRQRIQELEARQQDYEQLTRLVDAAARGENIYSPAGNSLLYVDPSSHQIVEANDAAHAFLGFERGQLQGVSIHALEVRNQAEQQNAVTYVETSRQEQIYSCSYRHGTGSLVPVKVYKRLVEKDGHQACQYLLEDISLHKRLQHELKRREHTDYEFQQKLKMLNEINVELSRLDSFDELCWHGVKLGVERLGFSRLSLWFLNEKRNLMVGSYGVNEEGEIRDERNQSWAFDGTHVDDFLAGKTEPVITHSEAPLYNDKSEILTQGWHISVPILNGEQFIGFMAADNFLSRQPMLSYEPELLRLYGITIGHLVALTRARNQALELRLEQERVRMLKTFLTDVGHDFRTPLAVINTNTYLLQKTKDDDRKIGLASTIQEQVMYITQMINDMLEIVKLEYELQLDLALVNLKELIISVVRAYNAAAAEKQIQWQLELDDTLQIKVDIPYLEKALGGIVKNALQYTQAGGRIRLSTGCDNGMVTIRIQDNGIGIADEHLDQIFKPLYRINEARTIRGSGLGLPIAKAIVEAHHGHITVESVLGERTTFEISLPLRE